MPQDSIFISLAIVILLFSVIVHEVMHGVAALFFGDHTAQRAGRLTLNPLPHIDPVGTILLPALLFVLPILTGARPGFFIGWAKPVPINPLNFSNIKNGELAVSLAGVGSNFVLAIVAALFYHLIPDAQSELNSIMAAIAQFGVGINLMLGVFNLLPIPPLDGSKLLMALLPFAAARKFQQLEQYGIIILIALLYFNIVGLILRLIVLPLYMFLGVPPL